MEDMMQEELTKSFAKDRYEVLIKAMSLDAFDYS
jgi:hypothetical protein